MRRLTGALLIVWPLLLTVVLVFQDVLTQQGWIGVLWYVLVGLAVVSVLAGLVLVEQ